MYNSVEVRWFSTHREESIVNWFEKHGCHFDSVQSRTDYYLAGHLKDGLGIKLREGNIELKQRTSKSVATTFSTGVRGFSEEWVKWSFNIKEGDDESEKILKNTLERWVPVEKKRMQVKLEGDGKISQVKNLANSMSSDCVMEYTWLALQQKIFYSFALEISGSGPVKLKDPLLLEILENFTLSEMDSYGYPEFLSKNLENVTKTSNALSGCKNI